MFIWQAVVGGRPSLRGAVSSQWRGFFGMGGPPAPGLESCLRLWRSLWGRFACRAGPNKPLSSSAGRALKPRLATKLLAWANNSPESLSSRTRRMASGHALSTGPTKQVRTCLS